MLFFALDGNFLQVCATSLGLLTKINYYHFYRVCSLWFTTPTGSAKFYCIWVFLVEASDLPTFRQKWKNNDVSLEDMSAVQAITTHHKLWVCQILA